MICSMMEWALSSKLIILYIQEKKNVEKIYCFFDEIQVVPGWEPFIDRLMRTENCEVYITGSSAHLLSKEIATQMRGEPLSWENASFSCSKNI